MDNGEVIPGLNENWTLAGCKASELISGLMAGLVFQELFLSNLGQSMPMFITVVVGTPLLLSTWRRSYPDEERGLRNHLMTLLGVCPPGLPKPAFLQPRWSAAPLRGFIEGSEYIQLGLDQVFVAKDEEEDSLQVLLGRR